MNIVAELDMAFLAAIIFTSALFWWVVKTFISFAVELYEYCRPMREEKEGK